MDTSMLGILAANAMEQVSDMYGDEAMVRTAAIVMEVDVGDDSHFLVISSEDRFWVQRALLKEGIETLDYLRGDVVDPES